MTRTTLLVLFSALLYAAGVAASSSAEARYATAMRGTLAALEMAQQTEYDAAARLREAMPSSVARVTAYTCDPRMNDTERAVNCPNGITSSGTVPRAGVTAACDRSRLGALILASGITLTCEDTGSSVNGNDVDMYVSSIAEAREWGVQRLPMVVLTP